MPYEVVPDEELTRWAWRDGIELERLRRVWRHSEGTSKEEVEIEDIDWDDIMRLMRELRDLRGIEKLYRHWGKAQLIRSGRVDWCQEAKDLQTIDEICGRMNDDCTISQEDSDSVYEILGPGCFANQCYGWS